MMINDDRAHWATFDELIALGVLPADVAIPAAKSTLLNVEADAERLPQGGRDG